MPYKKNGVYHCYRSDCRYWNENYLNVLKHEEFHKNPEKEPMIGWLKEKIS